MLTNNLTLDDEQSVQEELKALQEEAVCAPCVLYFDNSSYTRFAKQIRHNTSRCLRCRSTNQFMLLHQVCIYPHSFTIFSPYTTEPVEDNPERARVPVLV